MSFAHEIYRAFIRCQGYALSGIGLIASWAFWAWAADTTVKLKWLVPVFIVAAFCVVVLFEMGRHLFYERKHLLPRVVQGRPAQAPFSPALAWLVLESSPIFGNDGMISVYQQDGAFEILVGVGFVSSAQQNGLIQVVVTDSPVDNQQLWQSVQGNDANVLKTLIVKPSLPKSYQPGVTNV